MFHEIEGTLEVCGVAAWVEVLYDEMSKLSNIVVASCGFSFPEFEMLLPSGPKVWKVRDQSRHDFSFTQLVVMVENPVRHTGTIITVVSRPLRSKPLAGGF